MDHFAGLDVSVKETSVCILDDAGRIVKEVKVASEPLALLKVLGNPTYCFKRIGLEAGPLSQWLFSALAEAELPMICVESRHPDRREAERWTTYSRRPPKPTPSASPERPRDHQSGWVALDPARPSIAGIFYKAKADRTICAARPLSPCSIG